MANPARNEFEFAVIGGGLVGAAIAWGLAGRGRSVAMLDEGDIAYRASRGNFALVWVQSKGGGLSPYAAWTRQSADAWPDLADALRVESGLDVCLQQPGGFHLLLSPQEVENRSNALKRLHNQPGMVPFEYHILDRTETQRMLPQIGPNVAGSSFCPLDGHVNALRLLRALHTAFQRRRGSYLPDRAVQHIELRAGEFRLQTGGGEIGAAKVVLAAGLGNARLAPMIGLSAPVRPQRGQIIVTEKIAPFMPYVVHTIRQTDEGSVMISELGGGGGIRRRGRQRNSCGNGRSRRENVSASRQPQRGAVLGGAAGHASGRLSDLRPVGNLPRGIPRHLP